MYQLPDSTKKWDTEFFHTLISDKRIFSSKEAKEIREKLSNAGALPHLDHHFDWATLCIAYCFITGITETKELIITAPDSKGSDIPSFTTCFQDYSRLWLALLSQVLFRLHPNQAVSKEQLYHLIQSLWHTGAVELNKLWERSKQFKPDSDLEARQTFLNELSSLAIKNAGLATDLADHITHDTNTLPDNQQRLLGALQSLNIPVRELHLKNHGVRYDIYQIRLGKYTDLSKQHIALCSTLGIQESALHIEPCHNGESHAYFIKLLRPEPSWQKLGATAFKQALQNYQNQFILPICIGIDETGQAQFADLADAPHVLIGGTTGSGKSVFIRTLLRSLFDLCKGENKLEVVILDPKKVDYLIFENEEDLYEERIIDNYDDMYQVLIESVAESENRYSIMRQHNVDKLSKLPDNIRPSYRVIVVDELSNLIAQHEGIEKQLILLAQKARASGIHLILGTQRPDAKILNGELRANLPSRIAMSVQKSTESKIILDETGAEKLVGKGDHLVKWNNAPMEFLHGFHL